MNKDVYDTINDYLSNNNGILVQAERDFVLRKFLDSYYEAIEGHKKKNKTAPTEDQEQTILTSLLSDSNLSSYVESANKYYENLKNSVESDFKKKQEKQIFLKDVGVNIFSNIIYSIILIILFVVAEDQLSTWLAQLIK